MGFGSSKPEVQVGEDNVVIPPWARNYKGKTVVVFFDMEADGFLLLSSFFTLHTSHFTLSLFE